MTKAPKIQDIYDEYVKAQNEANREERYQGKEEYYHASGAGSCSRKLYFESVAVAKPTNSPKPDSLRKMRLGTIFHNEMEDCFTTQVLVLVLVLVLTVLVLKYTKKKRYYLVA